LIEKKSKLINKDKSWLDIAKIIISSATGEKRKRQRDLIPYISMSPPLSIPPNKYINIQSPSGSSIQEASGWAALLVSTRSYIFIIYERFYRTTQTLDSFFKTFSSILAYFIFSRVSTASTSWKFIEISAFFLNIRSVRVFSISPFGV
jgi:hypothetical protein